jgi:hypothetical protein
MLEIKVYSIIVSKVFGVTIAINFRFAIVKYMFNNYKWVVVVEKMELGNSYGEGKKCSLIIQATRMTLNIKGMKD